MAIRWLKNEKHCPQLNKGQKTRSWELLTCQSHLCAWEDHGTDALRSRAKTHGDREVIQDSQHCVTTTKSCLTSPVAFHDRMTASVDKERAADVLYLDIHKAFDTIPKNILLSKLERYGFDVQQIWSWLDGPIQKRAVNNSVSRWTLVTSGVPQQSAVQPVLISIFIMTQTKWIKCKLAEDTKLSIVVDTPKG